MSPEAHNKPEILTREEFNKRRLERSKIKLVSVVDVIPGINTNRLKSLDDPFLICECEDRISFAQIESANPLEHSNSVYSSEKWERNKPEQKQKSLEFIREAFKGQIVVDVGAGGVNIGYLIADRAEASYYVGVDPVDSHIFNMASEIVITGDRSLEDFISKGGGFNNYSSHNHKLNNITAALVISDALTFLRKLPDNSVSIFCSGIDRTIISNENERRAIAKEIIRVLNPSGGYIGNHSHIELSEADGIKKEVLAGSTSVTGLYRYKKV